MNLLLFRHGKSTSQVPAGGSDDDRALTPAGRADFVLAARVWSRVAPWPDLLLTSPLLRARQTVDVLVEALGGRVAQEVAEELRPEADVADALACFPEVETLCVVTHMPLIGELTCRLLAGTDRGMVSLTTGAGIWLELRTGLHSRDSKLVAALSTGAAKRLIG